MRWLCLDPGDKRTGAALSSAEETFAVPLTVLEHGPEGPSPAQIDSLMGEHLVEAVLVGIPLSMDNTLSAQSRAAIRVAVRIATHLGSRLVVPCGLDIVRGGLPDWVTPADSVADAGRLPVMFWDERLSTWSARRALYGGGQKGHGHESRLTRLDAHAAAVILQSYLDTVAGMHRRLEHPGDTTRCC